MRPRENGGWLTPFDPRRVDNNFTEANAWQYRFAVPHDVESLVDALGGDDRFVAALDSLFELDSETTGRDQADITGQIGQYAHGNEPSHHVAWLYHFAGRPDLSSALVDRIRREMYAPDPDGLVGNEDCGQMSSWYVFAALGLYPVTPGRTEYVLVAPAFESARIDLGEDRSFEIRRDGEGTCVQSARLNGRPLERSWISHAEISAGGILEIEVGPEPSDWGRAPKARPHSKVEGPPIVAAPWIDAPAAVFRDSLVVRAGGGEPSTTWSWNEAPSSQAEIVVRETGEITLQAERQGRKSPVVRARYWKIPHDWQVTVESVPNPQYTGGGALALLDGRRGDTQWRTGGWQGYQGQDFVATVDFGAVQRLSSAGAGFLQDQRSWILLPAEVVFEASTDGEEFRDLGRVGHEVSDRREDVFVEDFRVEFEPVEARFLRVRARSYGPLPEWHAGAGGESFLFIDEIFSDASPAGSDDS
jgi:hypothetical protein